MFVSWNNIFSSPGAISFAGLIISKNPAVVLSLRGFGYFIERNGLQIQFEGMFLVELAAHGDEFVQRVGHDRREEVEDLPLVESRKRDERDAERKQRNDREEAVVGDARGMRRGADGSKLRPCPPRPVEPAQAATSQRQSP